MKRRNSSGKVNKGAPSGLIISLAFHAGAFFVAGIFVVFTVLPKPKPVFEAPPPVERPKMQLKKPKVKIKKSSSPKPSSRIVANVQMAKMPEISIPDLVGTGEGLMGGVGGVGGDSFGVPGEGTTTLFGAGVTTGSDMEVTFYTMAKRWNGEPNTNISEGGPEFADLLAKFVASGWDKKVLSKLYRAPEKKYATTLIIPVTSSTMGPAAFGEDINYGYAWIALYEGKLVCKDDITFRFWGTSDDILTVAVDGEVVLAANLPWDGVDYYKIAEGWGTKVPGSRSQLSNDGTHVAGNNSLVGGDWITLEAGVPKDFKAITGEGPGGEFYAYLLVEVKGEDYPLNKFGGRIFPIFCTEKPSWELEDIILENLFEGDANVTNVTTIFKDY